MGICLGKEEPSRSDGRNSRLEYRPQLPEQVALAPVSPLREEIPIQNRGRFERYSYKELAEATNSFSHGYLLGKGAFGEVYKAQVRNQTVAIKRLIPEASEQQEATFLNEMEALSTISHENLVKLIGYCYESSDRLIVCEYCPNLSLRLHLHPEALSRPWEKHIVTSPLRWERRMQIAIGSARGLQYLHDDCQAKIIHRDIKPDNIVLDAEFKAKVVDFGLAKFFPESGSKTHISSMIRGTEVYADKEHGANYQQVSVKSDVYSFGVVLLELFSARKPDVDGVSILKWAQPLIKNVVHDENEIKALIDPKLTAMYNEDEMQSRIMEMKIMLFCAAASVYKPSRDRPRMIQIVEALEQKILPFEIWENDWESIIPE